MKNIVGRTKEVVSNGEKHVKRLTLTLFTTIALHVLNIIKKMHL